MGKQYHIQVDENDVGRYVILPGDPGRCEKIASHLDDAKFISRNREFVTYTGYLEGKKVSVTSTGIGGPSAAIAMEELVACKADTFVRIGTCGGINMKVKSGDCVIATGAIRNEGLSREYAPIEYPAVANQEREKLGLENPVVHDTDMAIRVAVEAIRKMIKEDQAK